MQKKYIVSALQNEEQRTVKWFLTLFYVITISYDTLYFYIYPKFVSHTEVGLTSVLGYYLYIILFSLIPISIYLHKKNLIHYVKYLYFITFTSLTLLNDVITYLHNPDYESGNVVEVFWLLLSPIFVNTRFFWMVSSGLLVKYILVGIFIHVPDVILPASITIVFSIIAYIILSRFQSYLSVIKTSYDQQLEGIVKGIIATLEMKDPYTRGHSERVAQYALLLAKETGKYSDAELTSFYNACLLHDIGKIQISDYILMKPGKLTDEEYQIVKTHPAVGAEAVKDVVGLQNYISVIRSHHERWDGKGYPDQLKGEETSLMARIVSIADAFDAMTSSRSYRSALPLEVAYNRIIDGDGTQFDPHLVKTFKKVYPSWVEFHAYSNRDKEETEVEQ
ncbi:HD-GYP domain-containing protein [Neobacillus sp. D3-1R]|uniref:HD-GYP domain-containing protein n=1 Tax=Neobacillus sp. D3-1R TaxID=3445778 RepID=UPI003F9FE5BC